MRCVGDGGGECRLIVVYRAYERAVTFGNAVDRFSLEVGTGLLNSKAQDILDVSFFASID